MKRAWLCVALVACGAPAFTPRAGDLAIVDAQLVTMTGAAVQRGTVVIRGDRIAAVLPPGPPPPGVHVIRGDGKWLMPGLADMHVHIWREDDLAMYLAAGVTTIRNMWGVPQHVAWRAQIARGERLGPTIVTAGSLIDGAPPDWAGSVVLARAEDADALVVAQQAAGYDFLKSVSRLSPAAYRALAAAARRHGMALAGHAPVDGGLDAVLAAHQRSLEHLDGYLAALVPPGTALPGADDPAWMRAVLAARDRTRLPALIQRTLAAGTWNCPTLVVYDRALALQGAEELARLPWLELMPAARRARWRQATQPSAEDGAPAAYAQLAEIVAALAAAGAPLLVGTDTGGAYLMPGAALHEEIERMVAAGVPRPRVLRAATADAWRYLGQPHEAGVIEAGARADLLLVGVDPLTRPLPLVPDGLVVRGRWLSHDELTAKLAAVAQHDAPPHAHWPRIAGEVVYRVDAGGEIAAERVTATGGQMFDPDADLETDYSLSADQLVLRARYHTMTLALTATRAAGAIAVTGTGLDGAPIALRAAAPAGALLVGPGLGGLRPVIERLADLAPGQRRALDTIELAYFPAIALATVHVDVVRAPDRDGHRVLALTTSRDGTTSELKLDRDGAIVARREAGTVAHRAP